MKRAYAALGAFVVGLSLGVGCVDEPCETELSQFFINDPITDVHLARVTDTCPELMPTHTCCTAICETDIEAHTEDHEINQIDLCIISLGEGQDQGATIECEGTTKYLLCD